MFRRIAAATLLATLPFLAAAQSWQDPHEKGAKEHPLVKFYPQSSVREYSVTDFDAVDFITGYDKQKDEPVTASLEGRIMKYQQMHKPGTSALLVVRNYENALKKAGLVTLYAGKGKQMPWMPINEEEAAGAFRLDRGGKPAVYVRVTAYPNGDEPWSEVTIVEIQAMEQVLEANADAWFASLQSQGRVAIYGINFDTGKATLRPESEKVLEEVRKLAKAHPDLKLRIEGHTDNVGQPAANRKLSQQRADAVKAWLAANGVPAAHLSTAGLGDTKPVADNGSEEGRAKNRRVELVKG